MPQKAVTKADDAKVRISADNVEAASAIAGKERRTLSAQINLMLDQWRDQLRSGSRMPRPKPKTSK